MSDRTCAGVYKTVELERDQRGREPPLERLLLLPVVADDEYEGWEGLLYPPL